MLPGMTVLHASSVGKGYKWQDRRLEGTLASLNQGHLAATELDENWTGWGPSERSTQQAEPVLADVERDAPLCKTLLGLAVHDHRGRAEASLSAFRGPTSSPMP